MSVHVAQQWTREDERNPLSIALGRRRMTHGAQQLRALCPRLRPAPGLIQAPKPPRIARQAPSSAQELPHRPPCVQDRLRQMALAACCPIPGPSSTVHPRPPGAWLRAIRRTALYQVLPSALSTSTRQLSDNNERAAAAVLDGPGCIFPVQLTLSSNGITYRQHPTRLAAAVILGLIALGANGQENVDEDVPTLSKSVKLPRPPDFQTSVVPTTTVPMVEPYTITLSPTTSLRGNPTETVTAAPTTTSLVPLQLPPSRGTYTPLTREEETTNKLLNLYFLLIAFGVIVLFIIIYLFRKRRKSKGARSLQRGQNALQQDLELGGWRIGMGGFGRWGGPAGARSAIINREEGLDERGQPPPPYTPSVRPMEASEVALQTIPPIPLSSLQVANPIPRAGFAPREGIHPEYPMPQRPPPTAEAYVDGGPRLPTYEDVASSPIQSPASPIHANDRREPIISTHASSTSPVARPS
ncbi:hypothetical protein BDZ91DRAFT_758692 [Kalaharituber pfeilii]|nr:hypothetical protein BDZ91DRAFT_758692 [Kalaharituber pfeilii]